MGGTDGYQLLEDRLKVLERAIVEAVAGIVSVRVEAAIVVFFMVQTYGYKLFEQGNLNVC